MSQPNDQQNITRHPLDMELYNAAVRGDLKTMKEALEAGANPSFIYTQTGSWGEYDQDSVIHKVLKWNDRILRRQGVELLLISGADPNAIHDCRRWNGPGPKGHTLEMVLKKHDLELTRLLVEYGADPNSTIGVFRGRHPVLYSLVREMHYHWKIPQQQQHIDLIQYLLEKGASPNARAVEYHSRAMKEIALHSACEQYCSLVESTLREEMREENKVTIIPEHDSDEEDSWSCGTILRKWCSLAINPSSHQEQVTEEPGTRSEDVEQNPKLNWYEQVIRILLEGGSDDNTPMFKTMDEEEILENQVEGSREIADENEIPTRPIKIIGTALHGAIKNNCSRLVKLLLAHGADTRIPYEEDGTCWTCLELINNNKTKKKNSQRLRNCSVSTKKYTFKVSRRYKM
ncbi:hypothetical protein C9374_004001 [Naegleria lovaniensis]|uniref:Ankyrin repeat protein n=1 Tax=Naegleria lovaniensis TaxID=51637 RepID=A0AA88KSK2_NAELO|nr:uncharacterized protein C9374_004001 [Naegleria lovaniensis]KAG2394237.1 hypothetical protein C9374_004001 [Naegleria lovaniensis]